MLDDDLCLSVRPGLGCACDNHLSEFSRRMGRSITLEELGMNETPEVLRVSEPHAVNTPSAVQNSK
jgi:hypothetical protein